MSDGYRGTLDALRQLGVLVGLVVFVLVAGFLLTGSPTAGIGAMAGVTVFFAVGTLIYVLAEKLIGLGRRLRTH